MAENRVAKLSIHFPTIWIPKVELLTNIETFFKELKTNSWLIDDPPQAEERHPETAYFRMDTLNYLVIGVQNFLPGSRGRRFCTDRFFGTR
jgi:hypothetical protein